MLVWVPDDLDVGALDGVEVRPILHEPGDAPDLAQVEVLVPDLGPLPPLERMASLRLVQAVSAGVDGLIGRIPSGVTLCDGRGIHDVPVAEWVLAALLAGAKVLPALRDAQREHRWDTRAAAAELEGARVLIVGHGAIGAAVEARLAPFGSRVTCVARTARPGVHATTELPALLPDADAVVLLTPLTAETHGMVGEAFLAAMRPGALLVNAARGALVDTDAVLAALRAGHVRAILDVTDPEPLPDDHPLWDAPGLLITPHVAGDSPRTAERSAALVRAQLERLLAGEPLRNVVTGAY